MRSQVVLAVLATIGVCAVGFGGYRVAVGFLSEQVVVGCDDGSPSGYCVYHRHTPGLLSDSEQLLIGPSPNRGLVYEIPYRADQVAAAWDATTDVLTVTMPGTTLTVTPQEYVDSR
ncbi:hypothetical protein [Nocardia thailandica]